MTFAPGCAGIAAPILMDKNSPTRVALVVILGVCALVIAIWASFYLARWDKLQAAMKARDDVLSPLRRRHLKGASGLSLFDPRQSDRVLFYGRRRELLRLDKWLATSEPVPVMVLEGGPLVGKTRLAVEWGDQLGPGWSSGWLRPGMGARAISAVVRCGQNTLIVVDRPSLDLVALLDDLAAHQDGPEIRLLIVTRSAATFSESLKRLGGAGEVALVEEAAKLRLDYLGETEDRLRWYDELCRYYARRLQLPAPARDAEFVNAMGPVPIGLLHMAALATVRAGSRPATTNVMDLLQEIWESEVRTWGTPISESRWGLSGVSESQLEQAVLALSILGPSDTDSAAKALKRVPDLKETHTATSKNIVAWAKDLYPSADEQSQLVDLAPRLIADAALMRLIDEDNELGDALFDKLPVEEALAILGRLIDAAPLVPLAASWVAALISSDQERLRAAMTKTLEVVPSSPEIDVQLARSAVGCQLDAYTVAQMLRLIQVGALPRTRVALSKVRVRQLVASRSGDVLAEFELGQAIDALEISLRQVGNTSEAVLWSAEPIHIYRRLAQNNPARFDPYLAIALGNHAAELIDAGGRTASARTNLEEALGLHRRVAMTHPGVYDVHFASALINFACLLLDEGQGRHALQAFEEAVGTYRQLAMADPAGHDADLATALTSYAGMLSEVGGRAADALLIGEESVDICRRLAKGNSSRYGPDLARALRNYAASLGGVSGRARDTLRAAEEAVNIYRRLAKENPARHDADLAGSLANYATALSQLGGRTADALKAAEETFWIYRRLAKDNPARHDPALASAQAGYAAFLNVVGRTADALRTYEEAIGIYRRLAKENPARHEVDLAGVLVNYAVALSGANGRTTDALQIRQEAIEMYRRLASDDPVRHDPDLALALRNHAVHLRRLIGRAADALPTIEESIRIYRRLAKNNPVRYGPELGRALRILDMLVAVS